uniref:uncharacterized protein ppp1r3ab n=1 Tax=Scatophagus argus TaxID=75038 RepID=UPI001ED85845|nr:uncharacterized protein ppp1r3ab [Scatophagus argus]
MEFVGQPRPSGAYSLLGVPGLNTLDLDVDDDEGEVVIGIRPKSSPLPRRKSSVSDEDSEPEPPLCASRRVSFADAKGLSLVQVKEFETWDVPKLPGYDSECEGKNEEEYFLSPVTFSLPLPSKELFFKVQEQKVELETIEILPGTTILKGVVRVLNISFNKAVYVRTTLDTWSSHFDLLAEYIPGSSDSLTDCFSFKITLVPPFEEQGARVDFCLRYETPVGTFWANNNNRNYVLFCHQREKKRKEKPKGENVNKKSCLKTAGQNFFTVDNISSVEDLPQENVLTGVSDHGTKVDTVEAKKISNGQSETSKEEGQKLLAESQQNCSRRNRRKAARMARVKDFFAQRDGAASHFNGTERDESPPEAKQAAQEETPEEKCSDVQSFSEGNSKPEGSLFVSESLEACSKPVLDIPHDTSPAHDYTSNSKPEKSETVNLADWPTLTGGESATDDIRNDDPAPAERQNINKSVSTVEESIQKQGMSYEFPSNIAAEPADSVISATSSESLVSKTNSFTFGTVVAPLYHQVFGRMGSESQRVHDGGNPVQAPLNVGNLPESYPHADRKETSYTVPPEMRDTKTSNSLPVEEDTYLSLTANCMLEHAEPLQDPLMPSDQRCSNTAEVPVDISADTVVHPLSVTILNKDLSNPQISTESLHLQGEAQEDNLTHDLRSQTTAETAQAQLPDLTCAQIKAYIDETHTQSETEEVMASLEMSFMSLEASQRIEGCVGDETDQQARSNYRKCVPQLALEFCEETNDVEEENERASTSNCHIRGDTFVSLKDKDTLKYEEITVSEKIKMEAAVSKQEDFCLASTAEVKNWEVMVEEEEENISTDEEDSKQAAGSKAEDNEEVEKVQREQLEDVRTETALETKGTTETEKEKAEDEMVRTNSTERETENKAEDSDALKDKLGLGDKQTGETVGGKDREDIEKQLVCDESPKMEKAAGEEELAEKREEQEESEKEKHFAVVQEFNTERINVQEEEELEREDQEVEIDFNNDDEGGVEWEDPIKTMEENAEGGNPDDKEEILVYETSLSVDAESESMTIWDGENEVGCLVERLDVTQNRIGDGLSAPVNSVQDEKVIDMENTEEGQNACTPNEMHLYKEDNFPSSENVTHDLSNDAGDESVSVTAEISPCVFADETENDQLSHDSTSAESDSDDEVELYMHCLRAVHNGAQAHKDRNKDTSLSLGKSVGFSVNRSKLLSTPMPSISESLDEEQHLSRLQDNHEEMETADMQTIDAALPTSNGQESINTNASRWIENFSCSNISKTLLYAILVVLFVVVAYHYDFLACFGLYLVSVIWLCCQGERQPVKHTNRLG